MKLITAFMIIFHFLCAESHLKLSILPFGKDIVLEESADLNLTCKVISLDRRNARFDLTWKFPTRSNANGDRITVYQRNDQLTVTIHKLQEDDTGQYVCKLQDKGIIWSRKISVFVRSKKCMERFFDCGSGLCISKHYVCDGYVDCPSGYDEAFKLCGPDACHGKILCDGRCISKELCCDSSVDANCSIKYIMPCCHNIPHSARTEPSPSSNYEDCGYGREIGYKNTVLYVVASFAAIVMIVSTAIIFLACRTCSRRAEELQRWARVPGNEMHRQYFSNMANRDSDSMDNIDFFFEDINSDECPDLCNYDPDPNFALCNFIPGVGFRVIDARPKPPPYTENVVGIPPPPYESSSDLSDGSKDLPPDINATNSDEEPKQ